MFRFFRRGRLDAERAREMQAHLDHHVDDLMAAGYERSRAVREARRRFGNATAIREEIYAMNSVPILEPVVRDLRYAIRMLRKTPAFTLAAVVTLALGIGANAAVFSVVNVLLLRQLPFPRPDRLALVQHHFYSPGDGDSRGPGLSGPMWFAVRDRTTTIDAAVRSRGSSGVNMVAGDRVAYVQQQRVSAGYFRVIGILPVMGREFTADDDRPGARPVAILNYGLWQRAFDGDRSVLGRAITLRGETCTVVGVMPANVAVIQESNADGGPGVDLWTPIQPAVTGEGVGINYGVVARLHDGVTWPQARNDVRAASAALFTRHAPGSSRELEIVPLQAGMTAQARRPVLMLWGAVGIVLLIACVNIAGLLLARGATRTREIATRMALGSGRVAVIRQLLVESVLLALLGGGLGLAVAAGVLAVLGDLGAQVFNLWQPLNLDARVLILTLAVALGTSVLFGLVPAIQSSRLDVQAALSSTGTRGVAGAAGRWPRRMLVIGEVALGVVLLVSAGLLIRTFVHLRDLNPGFDDTSLVTASVSLQDARYREPAAVTQLYAETLARLRAAPGIQSAAVGLAMPYSRLVNGGFRRLDGARRDAPEDEQMANFVYVTPGFFETLKVPLRAGRTIGDGDLAGAAQVVVVNDVFAARYYKDDAQVPGRHVELDDTTRAIVGVVGSTQQGDAGWGDFDPISPLPCVYLPVAQTNAAFLTLVHKWFQPTWVVRSTLPVAAVVPQVRRAIESVDSSLPIAHVRTIDDLRGERLSPERFMMWLVAGLGLIALLLAAVGLHGLIASSVSERTRELGIRLALGASARQAIAAVVVPGVVLAGIGIVLGVAAALGVSHLLHSFVWGVTPADPLTFAAVVATLAAVALIASLVPALRVLRLDPAQTLRAE